MDKMVTRDPISPRPPTNPSNYDDPDGVTTRSRGSSNASSRLRRASVKFLESGLPLGVWHATGEGLGKAPTPNDIVKGKFSHDGWNAEHQRKHLFTSDELPWILHRRNLHPKANLPAHPTGLQAHQEADDDDEIFSKFSGRGKISSQMYQRGANQRPSDEENVAPDQDEKPLPKVFTGPPAAGVSGGDTGINKVSAGVASSSSIPSTPSTPEVIGPNADGVYPNGYKFPPKHTRKEATIIGFKAFCRYTITPFGFLVVLYCLNIVAWGGMLFLLLIGGGDKYMCYPEYLHGIKSCSDQQSPRRIWIETDSQILNALFCVTGLGLIPWRFRDLFYLLEYRVLRRQNGLRRLGGIHKGWFRLPGYHELPLKWSRHDDGSHSDVDNPAVPLPVSNAPDEPLTGVRAPATAVWKLDFVIWAMVLNTFLQIVLCFFMWHYNRFNRPSWATGTFIALACIASGLGGLMTFKEAKKVKAVEGIPVDEANAVKDVEKAIDEKNSLSGKKKHAKLVRKHHVASPSKSRGSFNASRTSR